MLEREENQKEEAVRKTTAVPAASERDVENSQSTGVGSVARQKSVHTHGGPCRGEQ